MPNELEVGWEPTESLYRRERFFRDFLRWRIVAIAALVSAAVLATILVMSLLLGRWTTGRDTSEGEPTPAPASASANPTPMAPASGRVVVLVSLDGFRPSYLTQANTPNLLRFAREGVQGTMRPSFPSITYPNHYTLVTGVRPDKHGIIFNRDFGLRDGSGKVFTKGSKEAFWWNQATPIWLTAEQHGVRTATAMWPGSDTDLHVRDGRWLPFDGKSLSPNRVERLLALLPALEEPGSARPRFLLLYLDQVDQMGHRTGVASQDTIDAVREADAAIAYLLERLPEDTDVVIVSDHGMGTISNKQMIDLAPVRALGGTIVWDGVFIGIEPPATKPTALDALLIGPTATLPGQANGECWHKAAIPRKFAFGANQRIPEIVCVAKKDWQYIRDAKNRATYTDQGDHGYDPDDPDMEAIFIARGPSFKAGVKLPKFDNVSVYPLLARLLGIVSQPNDGRLSDTDAAMSPPPGTAASPRLP